MSKPLLHVFFFRPRKSDIMHSSSLNHFYGSQVGHSDVLMMTDFDAALMHDSGVRMCALGARGFAGADLALHMFGSAPYPTSLSYPTCHRSKKENHKKLFSRRKI